ncbi:hypothetical protein DPMN_181446 [Dreissena polymorpha]|uniref:Uncharacterized protein n=2 Tax=Dreissena polymorpha TaxID=45954 RepID=A0A9D4I3Q6_DREPO|nr:hypothetical protein DPMN_181446 [Dreissena polymorpha]
MRSYATLVLLIGAVYAQPAMLEIQNSFEFENALTENQTHLWVWRSEASGLKTLRVTDQVGLSAIELKLCIEPYNATQNVTILIDDIRYSNDGPSDLIVLRFNGITIGNFTTLEKWRSGHEWNVFRNSGNIGPALNLRKGTYTLVLYPLTDQWGVEFDRIRVNAENQNPDPEKKLFCGASFFVAQ